MSSTAPPTIGYGPLEAFLGAEEGVSFKADNGQILCTSQRENDFCGIEVVTNKVQSCKFFVEDLDNGKVRLKDSRGFYLRRTDRVEKHPIEVLQMEPDASCVFLVCTRNGNVIFQCDNGLFLSRIVMSVEAAKFEADVCCEFVPDIGSVIRPSFKMFSVRCFCSDRRRVTVSETKCINNSSVAVNHTFNLTWEKKVTEVTLWDRAWGLNAVVSADGDVYAVVDPDDDAVANADAVGDADADTDLIGFLRPTVTVCYDGVHGKRTSKEKIISVSKAISVTIPPKTTITAKLVVNMNDETEIPFGAYIDKIKVNGVSETFKEHGVWYGVVYDNVGVAIEESPFP